MGQYIPKNILVTEIKKRLHKYEKEYKELAHYEIWITAKEIEPKIKELKNLLSFIDTFEVKDVDLEKEITLVEEKYHGFESLSRADIINVATHFFEFGLKAQKGE